MGGSAKVNNAKHTENLACTARSSELLGMRLPRGNGSPFAVTLPSLPFPGRVGGNKAIRCNHHILRQNGTPVNVALPATFKHTALVITRTSSLHNKFTCANAPTLSSQSKQIAL